MIAYGAAAKVMISLYTTMLAEAELGAGSLPQALQRNRCCGPTFSGAGLAQIFGAFGGSDT